MQKGNRRIVYDVYVNVVASNTVLSLNTLRLSSGNFLNLCFIYSKIEYFDLRYNCFFCKVC